MKKWCIIWLLLIFLPVSVIAQVQYSGWLASFNTFKINNKLSIHFDAQLRSTNKVAAVQTYLLRPGINYHISKSVTASIGYAYIGNRRTINSITGYVPEHRIWQQAVFTHKWSGITTGHRLRVEQRFLGKPIVRNNELETDGYAKAYRVRYFVRNVLPLKKESSFTKGPFIALQNEVFLNTGNKTAVNGKTFDQNRLYVAAGYRLPLKIDLEIGYMNQYILNRNNRVNNHIAQLAVYKRL
jgi:hypothetical protein